MTYPNLFVIGAAKSGTTSLVNQLSQHPDVYCSHVKEPHYFCRNINTDWYYYYEPLVLNTENYLSLYSGRTEKVLIDASVHYLLFPNIFSDINTVCPSAKFIMMVRKPSSRIYSHYLMDRRSGHVSQVFETLIKGSTNKYQRNYFESTMYYTKYLEITKIIERERIMVIDIDEYINNNAEIMGKIYKFIAVADQESVLVNSNSYREPVWWLSSLYKSRTIRKVYNWLLPEYFKSKVRKVILKKEKKEISTLLKIYIDNMFEYEYKKILEVACNQ